MGRMRRATKVGAAVCGVVMLAGCGGQAAAGSGEDTRFADAFEACDLDRRPASVVALEDEGRTLLMDGKGEEDTVGALWEDFECVFDALGAPQSVVAKVTATRALDGRQNESWEGVAASWSYHPNSGLDLILEAPSASD